MNDYKKCAFNYLILSMKCDEIVIKWVNCVFSFTGQMRGPCWVRIIKVTLNWGIDTEKSWEIIHSVQKLQVTAYFTNKSQCYQFTCYPPTEEIKEITNPKNKFLKAKYQRSTAAFDTTIHGLTISVPVFILLAKKQKHFQ